MSPQMDGITHHLTASCLLIVPHNASSVSPWFQNKKKIETPPRIHQRSYFENSWILQRFKRILLFPSNAKLTNPSFFYSLSLSVLTLFDPALLLRNFVLQLSVTDLHFPPCPPLSPPPSQIGAKCHISTARDTTLAPQCAMSRMPHCGP